MRIQRNTQNIPINNPWKKLVFKRHLKNIYFCNNDPFLAYLEQVKMDIFCTDKNQLKKFRIKNTEYKQQRYFLYLKIKQKFTTLVV